MMTDENKGASEADGIEGVRPASGSEQESGDPGRTPGKAEGDEETVEESLKQKES
jgi:hypothetical protein